jgi:hypothetical protein
VKPVNTTQSKNAGWQHSAVRKFTFSADGKPEFIELHAESSLGDSPVGKVNVQELWPAGTSQEKIIPEARVTRTYGPTIPPTIRTSKTPAERKAEEKQRVLSRTPGTLSPATAAVDATTPAGRLACTVNGCCRVFTSERTLQSHLDSGKHQSQGSATSRSSKPVAPTRYTGMSVRDTAVDYLKQTIAGMGGANTGTSHAVPIEEPESANLGILNPTLFYFGWAKRITLHHPPLPERFQQFMYWAWHQGEIGPYKYTPSALLELAAHLGTDRMMHQFTDDPMWKDALSVSVGSPLFRSINLSEIWRVKQCYSTISTKKKAAAKADAMTQKGTPNQLREQLLSFLPLQPDLVGVDYKILVDDLIEGLGLGVDLPLHAVIQRHIGHLLHHG